MKNKTKEYFIFSIIALFFFSGCAGYQNQNSGSTSTTTIMVEGQKNIEIQNFAFNPAELTIKQGDTVVWTNQDSAAHQLLSDSGNEISSGALSNGQQYLHKFDTTGVFEYHCAIHPSMKAKITVE